MEEDEDEEADELQDLPMTVSTGAAPSSLGTKQGRTKTTSSQGRRSSGGVVKTKGKAATVTSDNPPQPKKTKTKPAPPPTKKKAKKRTASDAHLDADTTTTTTTRVEKVEAEPPHATTTATTQKKKPKYAHLKPRTRHIPQHTITTRWRPAPLSAQTSARALFLAAKRPVIAAIASSGGGGSDKRRAEAEATLTAVLRKLDKQLPRIPFPPTRARRRGGGGEVFELEAVVRANGEEEAGVTAGWHAARALREAVRAEEEGLRVERERLAVLEERGREAERGARERGRRGAHGVLRAWRAGGAREVADGVEGVRLVRRSRGEEVDEEEWEGDGEVAPLVKGLRGHLDSIRVNQVQVGGLAEVLAGTRVALDGVLVGRVGCEVYEGLVAPEEEEEDE